MESATVCEYCGHEFADPFEPAPGDSLFAFPPDDGIPQASTPAPHHADETAAPDSRDDTRRLRLVDLTPREDDEEPHEPLIEPGTGIEKPAAFHAEEAQPWLDPLTDGRESGVAADVSSHPETQRLDVSAPPAAAVPDPVVVPAAQGSPKLQKRSRVGRTEMMVGLGVAMVSGVLIMAFMSARGVAAPAGGGAPGATPAKPAGPAAPPTPAAARSLPQWTSNTTAWVGRERNSAAFELASINRVAVWMGHVQPMLVVRCSEQRTEVFVFTASPARMEAQDENHTVRVQFDGDAVATERWADSSEHDALFAPDGQAFLQRLLTSQRLQFGFSPHNAAPVVATFEVAGLAGHLASAARQCGGKNR